MRQFILLLAFTLLGLMIFGTSKAKTEKVETIKCKYNFMTSKAVCPK